MNYIIVGGGIAGISCAQELSRLLFSSNFPYKNTVNVIVLCSDVVKEVSSKILEYARLLQTELYSQQVYLE